MKHEIKKRRVDSDSKRKRNKRKIRESCWL